MEAARAKLQQQLERDTEVTERPVVNMVKDSESVSDFTIHRNTRCLNHIYEESLRPISIEECAAKCRNRLDCAAFTQYDNNLNGNYAGCFLYANDVDCKPGTKWVTAVKGLIVGEPFDFRF